MCYKTLKYKYKYSKIAFKYSYVWKYKYSCIWPQPLDTLLPVRIPPFLLLMIYIGWTLKIDSISRLVATLGLSKPIYLIYQYIRIGEILSGFLTALLDNPELIQRKSNYVLHAGMPHTHPWCCYHLIIVACLYIQCT